MKTKFLLLFFLTVTSYGQTVYEKGPDSWPYGSIPEGTVSKHQWSSTIFPNTIRDYYVYVPAQYDGSKEAALMVFQDGHAYVDSTGNFNVPVVFDNLIAQGKMPVTIGLFINPGHDKSAPAAESPWRVTNRSFEYDDVTDKYGRFLLEEMIPELQKQYKISDNPKMRAISGLSSGGICAFSVAWFFPDKFQKVLSHIGSFTNIRGGHNYPSMIRTTQKKDIKVFLQDGSSDLDNDYGNWWLSNLQMESALKYKGYDYKFVKGDGGHSGEHGGAILPESLIWLWQDQMDKEVASQVYHFPKSITDTVLMKGQTPHFKNMTMEIKTLENGLEATLTDDSQEQMIIIKQGNMEASLGKQKKVLGSGGVIVVMPGDEISLKGVDGVSTYYRMLYIARKPTNKKKGSVHGSQMFDFEDLEFKEHDKGGIRNYFHRETVMCPYYEMHMTTLNPGIKSHEPHVHKATELVFMFEGETEMEIGNGLYQGKEGDVYFLGSQVPHAIRNIGNEQCRYIAFQWN